MPSLNIRNSLDNAALLTLDAVLGALREVKRVGGTSGNIDDALSVVEQMREGYEAVARRAAGGEGQMSRVVSTLEARRVGTPPPPGQRDAPKRAARASK